MTWYEKIIAVHTSVTEAVSHGGRMQSDRYFVWQEDGEDDLLANNRHAERAMTGYTDLFTQLEFDPWKEAFERALNKSGIAWRLHSAEWEEDTRFWHYRWSWGVRYG